MPELTRRGFVTHTAASGAVLWAAANAVPAAHAKSDLGPVYREIERRHDETVARLQEWIHQPSIAAEDIGMAEGAELMRKLALDAGFQHAEVIPTQGQPGVFATLDAGAKHTLGLYFMYDVKQVDPAEWSSPPWDAKLVEMPDLGTVLMGRAATNQKGPQAALLAALHAIRGAGRKLPVNLVLVAEGEEEKAPERRDELVLSSAGNTGLLSLEPTGEIRDLADGELATRRPGEGRDDGDVHRTGAAQTAAVRRVGVGAQRAGPGLEQPRPYS